MRRPILCLDFDGVIHSYTSGWQGAGRCDDRPVPGTYEFLCEAVRHFRVMIYSSRSRSLAGRRAMKAYMRFRFPGMAVQYTPDGPRWVPVWKLVEFPWFKPSASVTIDDRALTFTGDWRDFPPTGLLHFKPWNKRPGHYLEERYGMAEKPDGWNAAVLGYFHRGPELRRPTPEFRGAFAERAARHEAGQNIERPIADAEPQG